MQLIISWWHSFTSSAASYFEAIVSNPSIEQSGDFRSCEQLSINLSIILFERASSSWNISSLAVVIVVMAIYLNFPKLIPIVIQRLLGMPESDRASRVALVRALLP